MLPCHNVGGADVRLNSLKPMEDSEILGEKVLQQSRDLFNAVYGEFTLATEGGEPT